jgi:hypothetical protein
MKAIKSDISRINSMPSRRLTLKMKVKRGTLKVLKACLHDGIL